MNADALEAIALVLLSRDRHAGDLDRAGRALRARAVQRPSPLPLPSGIGPR